MSIKEMPEVKAYKELKNQVDAEQKKLKDHEERLEKLRADLRKQEERVSKAESKKRMSLEKFAINEATQEEVNKAKRECLEALQECNDTRELITFLEQSVKKQKDVVAQLPQKIHTTKIAVWDKIAERLQGELETAIGDRAKLLWVAMLNTGHHARPMEPQYLPERLRVVATPHRDEITELGNKLWNEFVGAE
jgi:predicted  nucleic acid-binding Zn-ribbon protein